MPDIRKTIFRNTFVKLIFSLQREVYLVGGYVRDALCNRNSKDFDFAVPGDLRGFANRVYDSLSKENFSGSLVELKKEQMIRIILKDRTTIDFTGLGSDIRENLSERDFSMNAIAWSPSSGIIDPFNAAADIKKRLIRALSVLNLKRDPLRLLRAYRFAAELGWDIDKNTRSLIKKLQTRIKIPSTERLTFEFFKLMNSEYYQNALNMAIEDGLLEHILIMPQKEISENIKKLKTLEKTFKSLPDKLRRELLNPVSQELTWKGLLRLEQLLSGNAPIKNRLRLSRMLFDRLKIMHKLSIASEKKDMFSTENLFDTFLETKDAVTDFLIISRSTRLFNEAVRFRSILQKGILSSEEIMGITNITGGVQFGKIIYQLKKLQFEGRIKTKQQAVKWLKEQRRL